MYIYSAILKHGHSNFSLEIIEYCGPSDLISREQYYLDLLKPEYNLLTIAGNSTDYKHTVESKLQNTLSQHKRVKIEVIDLDLKTKTTYNSIREAAKAIGKYHQAITKYFQYKQTTPYLGRYIFKKVEDEPGGPKFNILNKIEDTSCSALLLTGQRNNILFIQTKSKNTKNSFNNSMFHTRVRAANRIGPHDLDVTSVIVGSLLGDCTIKRSVEGTRLVYKQSIVHKDYLFWLYNLSTIRNLKKSLSSCSSSLVKKSGFCSASNVNSPSASLQSKIDAWAKNDEKLNPNFVSGFVDGNSSFSLRLERSNKGKIGWKVFPIFYIKVQSKEIALLHSIQLFFGVGIISLRKDKSIIYTVESVEHLINIIIPHFIKYPLLTQKQADLILFKKGLEILYQEQPLSLEGFRRLVRISAAMSKGLTDKLKVAFPGIVPVERPLIETPAITEAWWVVGFSEALGTFLVSMQIGKSDKKGYQTQLKFFITLDPKDINLVQNFENYFGCGRFNVYSDKIIFFVSRLIDIDSKIIPFFLQYLLQGTKFSDFQDFCKMTDLIKKKLKT
jgi:hypothetical protein